LHQGRADRGDVRPRAQRRLLLAALQPVDLAGGDHVADGDILETAGHPHHHDQRGAEGVLRPGGQDGRVNVAGPGLDHGDPVAVAAEAADVGREAGHRLDADIVQVLADRAALHPECGHDEHVDLADGHNLVRSRSLVAIRRKSSFLG
jgi:hypothetical protein